jgi:outer membrane protein assembly factor BamB
MSIFSIVPTIGNILGSVLEDLFGEGEQSSVMKRYTLRIGGGDSLMDQIDFVKQDGRLMVANRTSGEVCLSFPAKNGYSGDMIRVPSYNKFNVGRVFKRCTENDIDSFTIVAGTPGPNIYGLFQGENLISLTSSGIARISGSLSYLGAYLKVNIGKNSIAISMASHYTISEIISLNVQPTEGERLCQINNY